jgi:hypothetical protein
MTFCQLQTGMDIGIYLQPKAGSFLVPPRMPVPVKTGSVEPVSYRISGSPQGWIK